MNKTKIDWADSTWNPVTGCLHGCEYCYARRIARRFCSNEHGKDDGLLADLNCSQGCKGCSEMDGLEFVGLTRRWNHCPSAAYPFGFLPTFHPHRLGEPARKTKPRTIFVCSMADLFGDWVPDSWIQEVFAACEAAPWHRYLFLTKNPSRYQALYEDKALPYSGNFWFGSTITTPGDEFTWFNDTPYHSFVSIEPILEPFGEMDAEHWPEWVIVGAETGKRKGKVVPQKWWIDEIEATCAEKNIPFFMKESLRSLMGDGFVQEYPWTEGANKNG